MQPYSSRWIEIAMLFRDSPYLLNVAFSPPGQSSATLRLTEIILIDWSDFCDFLQVRSKVDLFAVFIINEYLNTAELRSPWRQKVSAVAETGSDRQQQPTVYLQAELQVRKPLAELRKAEDTMRQWGGVWFEESWDSHKSVEGCGCDCSWSSGDWLLQRGDGLVRYDHGDIVGQEHDRGLRVVVDIRVVSTDDLRISESK